MRLFDIINVVDVETTCWKDKPPTDEVSEIIEVGLTEYRISDGTLGKRGAWLIKPIFSDVSEFCTELTGITPEDVVGGQSFEQVCLALKKDHQTFERPWAAWGEYDRIQFDRDAKAKKYPSPFSHFYMNLKLTFSLFYGVGKQIGLLEAVHKSRLQFEGDPHHAEDDAYNAATVLSVMKKSFRSGLGIPQEVI